jgi:hypothetical protein
MRTLTAGVAVSVALVASPASSQTTANPLTQGARMQITMVKNVIIRSAEKVPEDLYTFRPTPDVRSFAELFGHVADGLNSMCATAGGTTPPKGPVEKNVTKKAELIKALNDAAASCEAVLAKMDDKRGAEESVPFYFGPTPRLSVLYFAAVHGYEHYGNLVTYMRRRHASADAAGMDPFFLWLESTALSVWTRESTSILAFPGILVAHAIGMGFAAGINAMIALHALGVMPGIPRAELRRFVPIMWAGFWLNAASGVLLLIAYPTKALTNPVFYLKLSLIAGGMLAFTRFNAAMRPPAARAEPSAPSRKLVAALVCWAGAVTSGRLLAYTYTRLTASW